MKSIRFIHLSDIHIGLQTHGRVNPSTGLNTRLEDILKSLDYVFETARRESVDLILIAGDVFHRENPQPSEEIEFARRIGRVVGAGVRIVIVLGNHDYGSSGGKASAVEIFPALDIDGVTIVRKPELLSINTKSGVVQVACLPWAGRSMLASRDEYKSLSSGELQVEVEKKLIGIIRDLAKDIDRTAPSFLLCHVAARDAKLSGTELDSLSTSDPVVPVGELASPAFNYVALGHIHRFQDLHSGKTPPVVYSGSIERIDFTEEHEKKGFVMGELSHSDEGWKCGYEFVEIPARKFLTVELTQDDMDDENRFKLDKYPPEDFEDAVVRVRYNVAAPGDEADETAIKSHFRDAHNLKIERVFTKPEKIIRQTELTRTMGVLEALDKYIDGKPELKKIGDEMKSYAEKLIRETE